MRHCSQSAFYRNDNVKRKWISYSMSKDVVVCIPCMLFTDVASRGGENCLNRGNAFGYSNWVDQTTQVRNLKLLQFYLKKV